MPAPIISLDVNRTQNIYIAPDSVEFINQLGSNYTDYYNNMNFDWQRLAGTKVLQIAGMDPYDYVDYIAKTQSGNYLDHGVRVNSVYTSYRICEYPSYLVVTCTEFLCSWYYLLPETW